MDDNYQILDDGWMNEMTEISTSEFLEVQHSKSAERCSRMHSSTNPPKVAYLVICKFSNYVTV